MNCNFSPMPPSGLDLGGKFSSKPRPLGFSDALIMSLTSVFGAHPVFAPIRQPSCPEEACWTLYTLPMLYYQCLYLESTSSTARGQCTESNRPRLGNLAAESVQKRGERQKRMSDSWSAHQKTPRGGVSRKIFSRGLGPMEASGFRFVSIFMAHLETNKG